jgi:hypothetical protein
LAIDPSDNQCPVLPEIYPISSRKYVECVMTSIRARDGVDREVQFRVGARSDETEVCVEQNFVAGAVLQWGFRGGQDLDRHQVDNHMSCVP